jgi:anti-anti-sigma factor
MNERIETAIEHLGSTTVIHITGDLTAGAQEPLGAAVTAAGAAGASRIILAFRETDHINSAGIGVLISLIMECRQHGRTLSLVHPSSHFRRIFDLVGLTRYLKVFPDLAEAQASAG